MPFYNALSNCNNFVSSFTTNPRDDFGIYGKGYCRAACRLSEQILASDRFSDYEAYPVVFLFRHSLELYLKNIVYKAATLSAFRGLTGIDDHFVNNHDLRRLSQSAAKVLRKFFPGDEMLEQVVQQMVTVSSEFSDIDSSSFSYRYPIDRDGKPSTQPNQICNLEAMYRGLRRLLEELDTVDFGLDIDTYQAQELHEIMEQWSQP